MLSKKAEKEKALNQVYSSRYFSKEMPRNELPKESVSPRCAYQFIADELNLDGKAVLNLASFVTTWMEPEAEKLILENLNKNFVDKDEYPQAHVIQQRCVNILAHLFNAPKNATFTGTATIGSSEAVMLAGLSYKKKKKSSKPNIVMSTGVQVVWHKFAVYFDVEPRLVPMRSGQYTLSGDDIAEYVDENTIAVVGVLGITETGQFDPIQELNDALVKIKKEKGWDVPLHVDAASGGFVAPFAYPELVWDFRLEQVKAINVSGHKYGLVYPGIGWVIWRDEKEVPEDLIFHLNYLGGNQPTYTLNFSKGSSHIIAQYYNFMRLGREGYSRVVQGLLSNAKYIAESLVATGDFELLSDYASLPVVTASSTVDVFALSGELRKKGWFVPAYTMPPDVEEIAVIRVVVREGLSRDMAEELVEDIVTITAALKKGKQEPHPKKTITNHIC